MNSWANTGLVLSQTEPQSPIPEPITTHPDPGTDNQQCADWHEQCSKSVCKSGSRKRSQL